MKKIFVCLVTAVFILSDGRYGKPPKISGNIE